MIYNPVDTFDMRYEKCYIANYISQGKVLVLHNSHASYTRVPLTV